MDLYNNNAARRLAADRRNHARDDEEVILDAIRRGEIQTRPFLIRPGTRPASRQNLYAPGYNSR